ncbi:hypothetical protein WJX77_008239 [Trebouxia sp. C0004]
MVASMEMAVALRAKGGSSFLLQSWGIGAKVANDSMRSAASTLAEYASKGGQADIDGTGDTAPNFAYGDLLVDDARYRVVYRLVNTVYVMAVASAAANVFSLMKLVDAMTRMATLASRGVEVTPEKLSRRYPEVYAAVRLLVSSNGSADVSSILTEDVSITSKLAVTDPMKAGKSFTAKLTGLGRKTGTSTPDASFASHPSMSQRTVQAAEDQMDQVEFRLPPDALVPLPGSAPPPRHRPTAAPTSGDPFDAFGSTPAEAAAARDNFADLESLGAIGAPQAQAAAASDPFANMFGSMDMSKMQGPGGTTGPTPLNLDALLAGGPPGPNSGPSMGFTTPSQPQMSPQGDWAAFNSPGSAMSTPATAPWHAQSLGNRVQFTPPPKALTQPTEADLGAVANGESLQLLETWQGSFIGSKLLKAGVLGQVGSSGVLNCVDCSVGFRLQAPPTGARILSAGLRCALLNKSAAKRQPRTRSAFMADLGKLAMAEDKEPLLKYRLPAVACPPPLLLQITPVLPPESAGPKQAVLFVVQYCISPRLTGPLRDITMTLQVPKPLGQPSKVSSKASWSANQRQLRWDLPRLEAGTNGALRASFVPEYASEALASAGVYGGGAATTAYGMTCIAHFYGAPGQTLSGVAIESGSSADVTKPGKCMWHGTATAKAVQQ